MSIRIFKKNKANYFVNNSLSDATIATKIDVVNEELCNKTVATTPIIKQATGLEAILLDLKVWPSIKRK